MPHAIDTQKCMICHMCKDNCPQYAIDYVGNHLEVNPEKCGDCGLCVENCHSAAIAKVGEVKTIAPHEPYEVEADVVVLSGGISGLISAIRCAQLSGKKVVVLEKTAHVRGNAWFGHALTQQRRNSLQSCGKGC